MIGILDYGMGNLRSVYNAFVFIGAEAKLVTTEDEMADVSHLVIPGVGAFAKAMENLSGQNLVLPLKSFIDTGKPVLGICLGMQLLATLGFEPFETKGLDIIPGEVRRFENTGIRIPHVGWNSIDIVNPHYLFEGVKKGVDFYFVHSYHYQAYEDQDIVAICDYGIQFPAVISKGNTTGIQFHPEKSQKNGLKILQNFSFNNHYA